MSWHISLLLSLLIAVITLLLHQLMARQGAIKSLTNNASQSAGMTDFLRESEERLRMTLKYAPDAVFICEANGQIIYVNDSASTTLHYTREELLKVSVFDLTPFDWRESYRQGFKKVLLDQEHHIFEVCLIRKDAHRIPVELNAVLLPNGRIYGSCRDVTEREVARKALQDSQENLQLLLDSIAEGMCGADIDGNCTFVNMAFLKILDYQNADEIVGKNLHALIHHSYADGSPYPTGECRIYKALTAGQAVHVDDEVFWRKDKTAIAVEYWSHPVIKDGHIAGAVTTFLDITERKSAEQRIHQLAFYDPLTNLPNRRLLMERLHRAFAVSERNDRYAAVMFLDLDHFKTLNDTCGHDIGDLLLLEVAKRLSLCVRDSDTVARLGGDEFVVVLEALSSNIDEAKAQAEATGKKIRMALSQPYQLEGNVHHSSSSIGIVLFKGEQNNPASLLKQADNAMYQAKAAGRNTIHFSAQSAAFH